MKKLIPLLLAAVMTLGMAACGSKGSSENTVAQANVEAGLLRVAVPFDISTMDVTKTTNDYMVPMNVYDRLFEVRVQPDGSAQVVGSLCTDYKISDDGLTYEFQLKENVVFSNGNPLTASDVLYSFMRLLTAGGANSEVAMEVKGAEAVQAGTAKELEGFAIDNDHQFTLTLEKPNAGFLAELTGAAMSIVDGESMENAKDFGNDVNETIGTGPYKITEWVVNDHYTLEYNEKYWGEKPDVTKMIVNVVPDASTQNLMFQNGELDMLDLEYLDASIVKSTYKTEYADQLVTAPRVGMMYFALNQNNAFLSDPKVRKAIQMGVDIDSIITSIFDGDAYAENGVIPTGVWGHNDQLQRTAYDVEGAKALLKEAGYSEGQVHFELAMDTSVTGNTQLVCQVVQQQLKEIGVDVEIKSYDGSSWLDLRKSGEMDSYIGKWTMDYNDPANIMATFFGSPENAKIRSLNYPDTQIMERVSNAPSIVDDAQRVAEYQALEKKLIEEDAAWVPMLGNTHLFCRGQRVKTYVPFWAGYSDFYAAQVELN